MRQEAGNGGADAVAGLHAQQREVVGDALRRGLAVRTLADEHIGLVLQRALVVGIGPAELREQQRDLLEPRVGVRPAHEPVERSRLPVVVPGMELLEVLAAFFIGAGQGDLDHLAHLGRPAPQRLDELAQRQAARGLRLKSVFMNVLHGDRILAAVRRAHSVAAPALEPACDV